MLLGPAATAEAQRRRSTTACDPTTSTSFTFGLTGGNLRPTGFRIAPTGAIASVPDTAAARSITPAAVSALARLAWSQEFTVLPEAPTRPTRNPDAVREFIDVVSACGRKHVEYASGEGARAFRELYDLLVALAH